MCEHKSAKEGDGVPGTGGKYRETTREGCISREISGQGLDQAVRVG